MFIFLTIVAIAIPTALATCFLRAAYICAPRRSHECDIAYIVGEWQVMGLTQPVIYDNKPLRKVFKPSGVGYDLRGDWLDTFGYTIAGNRMLLSQNSVSEHWHIVRREPDRLTLEYRTRRRSNGRRLVLQRVTANSRTFPL